jgi:hypothetical protein
MFHERSMNVPEDQNVQEASGTFRNESFAKLAVSGIVYNTYEKLITSFTTKKSTNFFY